MIHLLQDLRDRRAEVVRSDQTWLDVTTAGVGTLVAALPLINKVGEWLAGSPYAWLLAALGLPLLACAALVYTICSIMPLGAADAMIVAGGADRTRYRYSGAKRQTAKALLLPTAALAVYQLARSEPNALAGERTVSGYVCSVQDNKPLSGVVEILDAGGVPVSESSETLDRSGFFHIKLQPWAFRPVSVRLTGSPCAGAPVALPKEWNNGTGCPRDDLAIHQPVPTKLVFFSCESKDKK